MFLTLHSVIGAGIVRTIFLAQLLGGKNADLSCKPLPLDLSIKATANKPSGVGFSVFAASLGELQLSIIAACAPALRAVFKGVFSARLSGYHSRSRTGASSDYRSTTTTRTRSIVLRRSPRRVLSMESATAVAPLTKADSRFSRQPSTRRGLLAMRWPFGGLRPVINETASFSQSSFSRAHEDGLENVLKSPSSPLSPVAVAYQPVVKPVVGTESAPAPEVARSVASDGRDPAYRAWWETGRHGDLESGQRMETIYIGRRPSAT